MNGMNGMRQNFVKCYKCGRNGHKADRCWGDKKQNFGESSMKCYACGKFGHKADKCENKKKEGEKAEFTCYSCGQVGHKANYCQNNKTNQPNQEPQVNQESQ